MLTKIARWIIFGALVSIIPLGVFYEILVIRNQPANLGKIMGNGELLIVTWVLCAGALGELLARAERIRVFALRHVWITKAANSATPGSSPEGQYIFLAEPIPKDQMYSDFGIWEVSFPSSATFRTTHS
jgi:hypothetical protein